MAFASIKRLWFEVKGISRRQEQQWKTVLGVFPYAIACVDSRLRGNDKGEGLVYPVRAALPLSRRRSLRRDMSHDAAG
ncbi:MAG: hypothetical protein V3S51_06600 [Dehalococcoidia bacterium]